jgi:uncharacterized protein YbjT (DUF2867 family)
MSEEKNTKISSAESERTGIGEKVMSPRAQPLRVAITGATGFVGSALASGLESDCAVIALGRRYASATDISAHTDLSVPGIVRRRCDLFSVGETRAALESADVAVYLVHSMSPNARLTQGRFQDLDLLLADNFGRAAAESGVRRIIYLGGLLPGDDSQSLSPHLASRLEVERALGAHGVPVTAVRAGLVVGAEGSSLNILVRLVERLPLMICPSWTSSRTQPIALSDVVEILEHCCVDEETTGRICEVGGPDVLSYREMMQTTAKVVGRRRPMIPVPIVTPALSELWVSLVTGTSRSLVRPLIESLRHPMVVSDPWLQKKMGLAGRTFEDALRDSLRRSRVWKRPIARSVQRFKLPAGRDALWVGEEYPRWLERTLRGLLKATHDGDQLKLKIRGMRRPMLILEREKTSSGSGRYILHVTGGLLAQADPHGDPRLEFRMTPDGRHVLAALQDFEPRLPWWIYAFTQARLHSAVMSAYRRYLSTAT